MHAGGTKGLTHKMVMHEKRIIVQSPGIVSLAGKGGVSCILGCSCHLREDDGLVTSTNSYSS